MGNFKQKIEMVDLFFTCCGYVPESNWKPQAAFYYSYLEPPLTFDLNFLQIATVTFLL
jgi:hypothetical protein